MKITPDTTITLYSGVDIGTEQQLAFSSRAKQTAYFASKVKKSYVKCTVVKNKIGVIKVAIKPYGQAGQGEITGTDLASCNYMSFTNKTFDKIDANTDRVIYAYIVDYSYENNETALIQYVIDYWQTWCFDVTYHDMYIDREHLSLDEWNKIEANPYRSDVPQMVTAEPLPTPQGYEKPFYKIKWYERGATGVDPDDLDGLALLSTKDPVTVSGVTGSTGAAAMIEGDWSYWNVLLILAPTQWQYFGESNDDGTINYALGDIVRVDDGTDAEFYRCVGQPCTEMPPSSNWEQMTVYNPNGSTTAPEYINTGDYAFDNYKHLWKQDPESYDHVFDPTAETHDGFIQKTYSSGGGAIEAEYEDIISRNNIIVTPAGTLKTETTPAGSTTSTYEYTWSVKPKGCDLLYIRSAGAWQELATFFSKYHAVSQIVGLFGVPADIINMGHCGRNVNKIGDIGEDGFSTNVSSARTSLTTDGKQKAVRNKKLYTSPFSYYRVIAPNGQVKEYAYEKFADIADTSVTPMDTTITFRLIADICDENPKLYFIPYQYGNQAVLGATAKSNLNSHYTPTGGMGMGDALENSLSFNMDEAICVGGFPEIGFNTDGYLTFLGNQYAQYMSERSSTQIQSLYNANWNYNDANALTNNVNNMLGSVIGGISTGAQKGGAGGAIAGGAEGLLTGGLNMIQGSQAFENNKALVKNMTEAYTSELGAWRNGDLLSSDDPYVQRFNTAKGAYANSVYTGGTGGVIRYLRGMGIFDFIGIHVQLRPEIIDYYDKWFDLYGYSSGRCGIPHVIDFVKGETGTTKVPHWATVNGANSTYIKTHDAKVEHAMLPVGRAIADMLNKGIRFQKGDLS